jgi:hypothetical protein
VDHRRCQEGIERSAMAHGAQVLAYRRWENTVTNTDKTLSLNKGRGRGVEFRHWHL